MRKRKKLLGIWVWQMKNSIVVVWLVQTFRSVVLMNISYWLSYKKLSEKIVYVSGTVSILARTSAVVRPHNSWYAHAQQVMCKRSPAVVQPLNKYQNFLEISYSFVKDCYACRVMYIVLVWRTVKNPNSGNFQDRILKSVNILNLSWYFLAFLVFSQ